MFTGMVIYGEKYLLGWCFKVGQLFTGMVIHGDSVFTLMMVHVFAWMLG